MGLGTRSQGAREKGVRSGQEPPAGKVTFHEKIGVHDISVVQVLNANGFIQWVENYFAKNRVSNPNISKNMEKAVEEYLKDNLKWFVFDVVQLEQITKTQEAIQYKFKSNFLFYPLKISNMKEGSSNITLLILTPQLLGEFSGLPKERIRLLHEPLDVSGEELKGISEDLYNSLGEPISLKLRSWSVQGELSSFNKDLIVSGFAASKNSPEYYIKYLKFNSDNFDSVRSKKQF